MRQISLQFLWTGKGVYPASDYHLSKRMILIGSLGHFLGGAKDIWPSKGMGFIGSCEVFFGRMMRTAEDTPSDLFGLYLRRMIG